jgi:hypothetical protein
MKLVGDKPDAAWSFHEGMACPRMKTAWRRQSRQRGERRKKMTSFEHLDPAIPEANTLLAFQLYE